MEIRFSSKTGTSIVHPSKDVTPNVSPGTENVASSLSESGSDYAKVDLAQQAKPKESALSLLLSREGSTDATSPSPAATPGHSPSADPERASSLSTPDATNAAGKPRRTRPRVDTLGASSVSNSTRPSAAAETRNRTMSSALAGTPGTPREGYGFMFGAGEIGNVSSPRHYSIPTIRDRFNPSSVEARFIVNVSKGENNPDPSVGSPASSRSASVASIPSSHNSFLGRSLSKLSLSRSNSRASLRRFGDKPWKQDWSPDPNDAASDFSPNSYTNSIISSPAGSYMAPSVGSASSGESGFKPPQARQRTLSKSYGKIGKTLGEGAGGHVKIVKSTKDSKVYAVKEFRTRHHNESAREYQKKVGAEYCLGLTLKHPNIINTLDIITEGDHVYQVMEYCEFDLFAIVMSGKMTYGEVFCDFRQIMEGVRYLHGSGLAHRDLKLDNCVVTHQGIVKIIDFGSSVVYRYPESDKTYDCDGVVGSDPYLAPEAAGPRRYSPTAADIWSTGIVLCCMLMRKFPWKAPRMSDSAFKSFVDEEADGQRPGLQKLLGALPSEVQPLVKGMLELNPEERFDIEQCWADSWLSGSPHCTIDDRNNLVKASGHTHSAVAFEEAHIAMLERKNRKAKKGEKMW